MKLVNRYYLFGPLILLCVIISMLLSFLDLYPRYTSNIVRKEELIERISMLSQRIDTTNAKISVVTEETQLIKEQLNNNDKLRQTKHSQQSAPSRNPTMVSFVPRLEIFIGEFSSYKASIAAYKEFREQNDIDCTIIEMVKGNRYLLVAENPKKFYSRSYVPGQVIKLSRRTSDLGMRPIYLSGPDKYSFVDGN
jgi:hypothetical protein